MKPSVELVLHSENGGAIEIVAGAFRFGPGRPALMIDGQLEPLQLVTSLATAKSHTLHWQGARVRLVQDFAPGRSGALTCINVLNWSHSEPAALNRVVLFASPQLTLGAEPANVRILEQSAYLGRVRTPRQMFTGSDGLKSCDGQRGSFVSQTHTVFYCPRERMGVLLGFSLDNPWLPEFRASMTAEQNEAVAAGQHNVDGGQATAPAANPTSDTNEPVPPLRNFSISFDGSDYRLEKGFELSLGEFVIDLGDDGNALLARYGDWIKAEQKFPAPPRPFANWCSWYPYRLGVTQDKVLATALAARSRNLHQLGLHCLQVDLGWQQGNLPTSTEPNERFAAGLVWLADKLNDLGLELGLWVAPLCVADTHPVAREHPEWLLRDTSGKPHVCYHWFWEPFCPIYALDVSHPDARMWLGKIFEKLAAQGARYLKWDFAGIVSTEQARGRHDPKMVSARARGAVAVAFAIAQETFLQTIDEPVLLLDCSGVDGAGAGVAPLSYVNMDTGNTGLGWSHLREVYTSFACHLFKHRWALLQPSCLVVGLPGTLEEARVRATATFMGAGHVDIGDDLTTLPEDRWNVLLATLPPNDVVATPVDLFHPIRTGTLPYVSLIKSKEKKDPATAKLLALEEPAEREPEGACVWAAQMKADWDSWTLVAVFNWSEASVEPGSGASRARRFQVELTRLGLDAKQKYWAYEFWSGQFLGEIPRDKPAPDDYQHPGDFTHPIQRSGAGWFDIGFHGPAVKLVVLRKPRAHPWPVGTSFHQSGGRELAEVKWSAATRTLSGVLLRPEGERGVIMIAGLAEGGVHRLAVNATSDATRWSWREAPAAPRRAKG